MLVVLKDGAVAKTHYSAGMLTENMEYSFRSGGWGLPRLPLNVRKRTSYASSRSLARRHRSQNYASQTQVRRRARKAGRSIRPDIAGLYHHLDPVISWHSEGRGTMHERSNLR